MSNLLETLHKLVSEVSDDDLTNYFEGEVEQSSATIPVLESINNSSSFTQEQKDSMSAKVIEHMKKSYANELEGMEKQLMQEEILSGQSHITKKPGQNDLDKLTPQKTNRVHRPRVFIEFSSGEKVLGRLEIQLFSDIAPKTAENFRALCTGEKGIGRAGEVLHYKGTSLFAKFCDCFAAGNTEKPAEKGLGSSIYGGLFENETYLKQHFRGAISMEGMARKNGVCGSSFVVCTQPIPWMDGSRVVFGKVINNLDQVVDAIENAWDESNQSENKIIISDCGML